MRMRRLSLLFPSRKREPRPLAGDYWVRNTHAPSVSIPQTGTSAFSPPVEFGIRDGRSSVSIPQTGTSAFSLGRHLHKEHGVLRFPSRKREPRPLARACPSGNAVYSSVSIPQTGTSAFSQNRRHVCQLANLFVSIPQTGTSAFSQNNRIHLLKTQDSFHPANGNLGL